MKTFSFLLLLFSAVSLANSFGPGQSGNGARSAAGGTGITTLNSQTQTTQSFAAGTAGTDFAISSSAGVHTFDLPSASASARGLVSTGAQTIAGVKTFSSAPLFSSLTASRVPYLDASKNLATSSVTDTELGYLSGVTSAIQTQLNAKAPIASPSFTGTVTGGVAGDTSTHLFYGTNFGLIGSTSTSEVTFYRAGHDTGNLKIQGGTSTNSALIRLYGSTHASAPMEGRFYSNNTLVGTWLDTGWTLPVSLALSAETASRAAYFDSNKKVRAHSTVSDTELGYLDGLQGSLAIEQIDGMIETPSNKTYILRLNAKYPGTISNISLKTASGTITAKLQKEGVDVTSCTAISVTSTESTTTCTAANTFVAGDTITLVTTSNSSAADLQFSVQLAR